jgi:hypothetical protein
MRVKYFTVEEANALLPKVEPLMAQLLERRARVTRSASQMQPLLEDVHSDVGSRDASELVLDFRAIERLVNKIQAYGCVVKDINVGLLDFLADRHGRDVYLCWRYGEPRIEFYHDLHNGFSGRQPI